MVKKSTVAIIVLSVLLASTIMLLVRSEYRLSLMERKYRLLEEKYWLASVEDLSIIPDKNLRIIEVTVTSGFSTYKITGKVANVGNRVFAEITVFAFVYDLNGTLDTWDHDTIENLHPNEIGDFEMTFSGTIKPEQTIKILAVSG